MHTSVCPWHFAEHACVSPPLPTLTQLNVPLAQLILRLLLLRIPLFAGPCVNTPSPLCNVVWSDGMFRVGHHAASVVTDDQLVAALASCTGLEFVFLNACNSLEVCRRIQDHCGVPVVVGWDRVTVPAMQCFVLVRVVGHTGCPGALLCVSVALETPVVLLGACVRMRVFVERSPCLWLPMPHSLSCVGGCGVVQSFLLLRMLYVGRNYETAFARAKCLCAKLCRVEEAALGVQMLQARTSRSFTKVPPAPPLLCPPKAPPAVAAVCAKYCEVWFEPLVVMLWMWVCQMAQAQRERPRGFYDSVSLHTCPSEVGVMLLVLEMLFVSGFLPPELQPS